MTCALQDSIFLSVKQMAGLSIEDDSFNLEVLVHTNSVLNILWQLGVGSENFVITGESETWRDFLGETTKFEMVKTFVYLKTRLVFDPPANSVLMQALKEQAAEYEWRICNQNGGEST